MRGQGHSPDAQAFHVGNGMNCSFWIRDREKTTTIQKTDHFQTGFFLNIVGEFSAETTSQINNFMSDWNIGKNNGNIWIFTQKPLENWRTKTNITYLYCYLDFDIIYENLIT